jgi:hypothetical protein
MAREDRILPPRATIAALEDELGVATVELRKLVKDDSPVA